MSDIKYIKGLEQITNSPPEDVVRFLVAAARDLPLESRQEVVTQITASMPVDPRYKRFWPVCTVFYVIVMIVATVHRDLETALVEFALLGPATIGIYAWAAKI